MASLKLSLLSLSLLFTILAASARSSEESTLEQWAAGIEEIGDGIEEEFSVEGPNGRSLLWRRLIHYYISYGALSANRIPCPPRSGRSYYTHNCYRAGGPVHPYTRGCSAITRCRR